MVPLPANSPDRAALIERIADLIRLEGNPPTAILRLAYLNKARALEIARKVLEMVEGESKP